MTFVDANIFLRFLTRDDEEKANACLALFRRVASGEQEVVTSDVVIAEVVYVLGSPTTYRLSKPDIRLRLKPVLTLKGLKVQGKREILRALDLLAVYPFLDFEDALSVAWMEHREDRTILSYDVDFDRIPGIQRIVP